MIIFIILVIRSNSEPSVPVQIFRQLEKLLPTGDKSDKMGEILRSRGSILYRQKQYAEAAANYQQAADIYKILPGSDVKYQDALSSLNRCHTMMGNETEARQTEQRGNSWFCYR